MIYILRNKKITQNLIERLNNIVYGDGRFIYQCNLKEHRSNRSDAQNRMMHAWFMQIAMERMEAGDKIRTPKVWKIYLKQQFLGEESIEMPDGTRRNELRHTSDLNTKEMSEFLEKVDHYAGAELCVQLIHPVDYSYAMGGK